MPDLIPHATQQCHSLTYFQVRIQSDTGNTYHVTLGGETFYPVCNCPAYVYGRRTVQFGKQMVPPECKHIQQAEKQRCGWHREYSQEQQTPEQERDHICPRCGGPTDDVLVAA